MGVGGWSVECGGESVEGKREHRRVYTHSTLSSLCPAGKVSLASGSAGLSQVACPPSLLVSRASHIFLFPVGGVEGEKNTSGHSGQLPVAFRTNA